ncbi:MAG TPA: aminotransferase class IV [Cyclobacteriaceae bacterium]|nr:aminotransferase class IV [Cyclobacteriaceae bacterium]
MFRLLESIRLHNGHFHRLNYHQQRMDQSVNELFDQKNLINLFENLKNVNPPPTGLYKCRVVYSTHIESVEFIPYAIKPVNRLKAVYEPEIEYSHKFADRTKLNALYNQRQSCDDILIIKNGLVTDASYSNIVFYDGVNRITPDTPLLKGTMRQFLLDTAAIQAAPVPVRDISSFKSFRLINSMLAFDGPEIDVSKIVL